MTHKYAAICADYYINQRLHLKMDLPTRRDTVLGLFERVRREHPAMDRFRRYQSELALEARNDGPGTAQEWVAVRKTSIRSGSANPTNERESYALHRLVLESAPYYLDISPLDVDHMELLYGFDLPAPGNHDAIVFNALMAGSPMAAFADESARTAVGTRLIECEPTLGIALNEECTLQATIEIKTRTSAAEVRTGEYRDEPISLYLIMRQHGPFGNVKDLPTHLAGLIRHGEELLETRVVPHLLMPIRDAIVTGS